jgi:hypothetical protein
MRKLICAAIVAGFLIPAIPSVSSAGPLHTLEKCMRNPMACITGRFGDNYYAQAKRKGEGMFRPFNHGRPRCGAGSCGGGATRDIKPVEVAP